MFQSKLHLFFLYLVFLHPSPVKSSPCLTSVESFLRSLALALVSPQACHLCARSSNLSVSAITSLSSHNAASITLLVHIKIKLTILCLTPSQIPLLIYTCLLIAILLFHWSSVFSVSHNLGLISTQSSRLRILPWKYLESTQPLSFLLRLPQFWSPLAWMILKAPFVSLISFL